MLTRVNTEIMQRMIGAVSAGSETYLASIFVNESNRNGETPTHMACTKGDLPAIQTLCIWEANLAKKDKMGRTPIMVAWGNSHDGIVDYMRPLTLYAGT